MTDAVLAVQYAGPLVSIQDEGRAGHMRFGVPQSGPMDRLSFRAAHAALGQDHTGSAIEVSLGGIILKCIKGAVTLAIAGGDFSVAHAGATSSNWTVLTIETGQTLSVRAGGSGSWAYIAFAGALQSRMWLGSAATHTLSGFGGGVIQAGDSLRITHPVAHEDRLGQIERPIGDDGPIRVVMGPQDHHFDDAAISALMSSAFNVSDAYDRMGMQLTGPKIPPKGALSIPSEPVCRGSIQVNGDGIATVLLADHQTTGGYPKIATVVSVDQDRLAQMRAGDPISFAAITPQDALALRRKATLQQARYLEAIAIPKGSLEQRLMRENLVGGIIADAPDD
ncbi:biotin-dependent carboxyltransferase family protein [Nereida sp. MMG025]|uniref:5-oxoprolinase subunit C family protein n=1 Tax=Nereida sp. MMG025 TaxID=2909981 RepID=UPI001F421D1B|nr:biotin-dependent carboxyltransferase family protein [Nereida sp. MMG025]MCF6444225.1 biotin-dependent carboxyltransferase family protein [Nereida sp. MMG025]